ncbi:MAG: zinc ribbon domain-containing protein [Acidobacteria bacterium]|nr:MAG: zinc ribbon domain-containing protein [Acidobacteriota bacterium]
MYCPSCGKEQINENVRFCAKCGFPLSEVSLLLASGGNLLSKRQESSKKKGIKQGVFMMLLTLIIVPLLALVLADTSLGEILIPSSALILFIGGILRIIYAIMFEDKSENFPSPFFPSNTMSSEFIDHGASHQKSLEFKADTSELITPASVTEDTTKLLELKQQKKD